MINGVIEVNIVLLCVYNAVALRSLWERGK